MLCLFVLGQAHKEFGIVANYSSRYSQLDKNYRKITYLHLRTNRIQECVKIVDIALMGSKYEFTYRVRCSPQREVNRL